MVRAVAILALLTLAAGCGTQTEPRTDEPAQAGTGTHDLPPVQDRVPITPRAVAAIALDHLPQDTSSREAMYTDRRDAPGTLGADLTYNATGEYDGDSLSVGLAPGERDLDCEISHCADLDTDVKNASMVLVWQELEPEEDPGIVTVLLYRDGEKAWVHQSWEEITGDPRDLNLQISVDEMVEVLEDPWLRLETSPDAIAAGERLDDWG